ncbi:MAG: ATP/GTP-binding protein [Pseudomonadota bacterium]|nr:ATP/GTP-binding protein [Pseudomonadota bacterium]
MEWDVLFMGPVGAGKTQAIQSISDIDVINTDVEATDATRKLKTHTTVSMDVGVLHLSDSDKLRLYGAPGQDRFDFMWDILLQQAKGVALILNHASLDPLGELEHYLQAISERVPGNRLPLAIGVTHTDENPGVSLSLYEDYLRQKKIIFCGVVPPVIELDARIASHVRSLLLVMVAQFEMAARFPTISPRLATVR